MKTSGILAAGCALLGCLFLSTLAVAQAAPKGELVVPLVTVKAKVTKINHRTREISLKLNNGRETSFVMDPSAKNFDQVKKGDMVTATYTEAIAYEVRKSGSPGVQAAVAGASAAAGMKPAAVIGHNTTLTVAITEVNGNAPSVTVKGSNGDEETIRVASPDKLQGLKVGDMVDISYTKAIVIKVEDAPKQ